MGERLADFERRSGEPQRAPARPEQAPRLAFSRDGLAAAVTDIRTRQRMLDDEEADPARQPSATTIANRASVEIMRERSM